MRRSPFHPLIAILCALFLLGAQQAAYAHFVGHLGIAAEIEAKDGGDSEHGTATTLSHVCTTCAAFTALDAPLRPTPPGFLAAPAVSVAYGQAAVRRWTATAAPPYGARAPPAIL